MDANHTAIDTNHLPNIINILVADDEALFCSGLELIITRESNLRLIAIAKNGKEAIEQFLTHQPDLILMDIQMPEMNGIEAIQAIRSLDSNVPILVLTTFEETEFITNALAYGANGYIIKGTSNHKLIQSIHDVMNQEFILPASVAAKLSQFVLGHREKNEPNVNNFPYRMDGFSKREQQILPLFYARYSVEEIAETCNISVGTLRNHLSTIYEKLNVTSKQEALKAIANLPLHQKTINAT